MFFESLRFIDSWWEVFVGADSSQQTQNICITFIPRWTNVEDVGPTLHQCYTNGLCLLGTRGTSMWRIATGDYFLRRTHYNRTRVIITSDLVKGPIPRSLDKRKTLSQWCLNVRPTLTLAPLCATIVVFNLFYLPIKSLILGIQICKCLVSN